MKRYYKVSVNSETGLKLKHILDRADKFDEKLIELSKKYGFTEARKSNLFFKQVAGVIFDKEPDMKSWKKVRGVNKCYDLRAKCKDKELEKDFKELYEMNILRSELDRAVGNTSSPCYKFGFDFSIPGVYILIADDSFGYEAPEDCEEITNIEYLKLEKNNSV